MPLKLYHTNLVTYSLLALTMLSLTGCGDKNITLQTKDANVNNAVRIQASAQNKNPLFDKLLLSQNPLDYVKDNNSSKQHDFLDSEFAREKLFMVWNSDFTANISESAWVFDIIKKEGFKENLTAYDDKTRAKFSSDIYSSVTVDLIGITTKNSDIRAFPTKKPYFYDPSKAGEGYPFDNFQASRIYINTPVKIVAQNSDGAFFYVATSLTDGWVDSRDILLLTKEEAASIRKLDLLMCVKDKSPIMDEKNKFIEKMQVGSFVFYDGADTYSAVNGRITKIVTDKNAFVKFPLMYSKEIFAHLASQLMDEPYGWGGALDDRDCSMFLRDLFLPFGLYLPRNSYAQAKKSEDYEDLSNLSESKRLEYIKQKAEPFSTLLYLKGHILLYLGVVNNEVIAMHDVWGFTYETNGTEHRYIIGKPSITTMYMGQEYPNYVAKRSLASRLLGIRVLK